MDIEFTSNNDTKIETKNIEVKQLSVLFPSPKSEPNLQGSFVFPKVDNDSEKSSGRRYCAFDETKR